MNDTKIKIMVIDDQAVVRQGFVALINTVPDMAVVAEGTNGQQAIELYRLHRPDVTLMDLRMPELGGVEAIIAIRKEFRDARLIVLTTYDGDEDIYRSLQAGAQGYVLKSSTGEKLIPALRAVAAGQRWIPKEVSNRLAVRNSFEDLTPREMEVLNQLAKGLANKEIADVLTITEHTAKDHLKSILAKLRVADRTEAVTAAIQRGIIHL